MKQPTERYPNGISEEDISHWTNWYLDYMGAPSTMAHFVHEDDEEWKVLHPEEYFDPLTKTFSLTAPKKNET